MVVDFHRPDRQFTGRGSSEADATRSPSGHREHRESAPARAIELMIRRGTQALWSDGDLAASRVAFNAAYRYADAGGDDESRGLAAVGLAGLWVHEHRSSQASALVDDRLRRGLAGVDPESTIGLRLRARIAAEQDYRNGSHSAILGLVDEARRCGDAVVLAETLHLAHQCVLGPGYDSLRKELALELIVTALETGRRCDVLLGLLWKTVDLLLVGDSRAERSLTELHGMLKETPFLAVSYVVDAIRVMLEIRAGNFEKAEVLAAECAERGRVLGDVNTDVWYGAHIISIRWYQGRLAEALPLIRDLVDAPALSEVDDSYLSALAVGAALAGSRNEARNAMARLVHRDLTLLAKSSTWLVTIHGLAEAAFLTGDATTAATAYELLRPFSDVPLTASLAVACFGSVQHALGIAASAMGDWDLAVDHLRAAVQANAGIGHRPATVMSRLALAGALAMRSGGASDDEVAEALAEADVDAADMGMRVPSTVVKRPADPPDLRQSPAAAFERSGTMWQIRWGSRTAHVKHSIGIAYIAQLARNPGCEIPAVHFGACSDGPREQGVILPGSHQPVFDEQAKQAYRRRLAEIEADIDEYEAMNDVDNAGKARIEREWLLAELTSAAGLGGRVREFTTADERARISVGKAIRRALDNISAADVVIGEALRMSVQTGQRCVYRPVRGVQLRGVQQGPGRPDRTG